MEIAIAIFAFILHGVTAFGLIYSCDAAQIWGVKEKDNYNDKELLENLRMPKLSDLQDDNAKLSDLQEYVDEAIKPATKYFSLRDEIVKVQSDCDIGLIGTFFLQSFSILLCATMLFKAEAFDSFIISVLIVAAVCTAFGLLLNLIYNRYWRCRKLRQQHFNFNEFYYYKEQAKSNTKMSYEKALNNIVIEAHYYYLYNIKETVALRHFIRKVLYNASIIIYMLFFFTTMD